MHLSNVEINNVEINNIYENSLSNIYNFSIDWKLFPNNQFSLKTN